MQGEYRTVGELGQKTQLLNLFIGRAVQIGDGDFSSAS